MQLSRSVQNKIHNLQSRLEQFTDETKKLKNTNQLELHFPHMTILKALKHKHCSSLDTCHKYVVQFTDPTPAIYWYAQRAKLTFLNMPVLNTVQ